MDLFLPAAKPGSQTFPAILVIQGGGFRSQDGRRFHPFAEYFSRQGFASATFPYQGSPEVTFEETLDDVQAAFQHLRTIGAEYGIDPDRVGVFGRSAGATLATLLATSTEAAGGPKAIAAVAGVYDFIARFSDPEEVEAMSNVEEKQLSNGKWIGETFSVKSDRWRQVSPVSRVRTDHPPTLLMHAKDDAVVFWRQTERMANALRNAGHQPVVFISEDGGHGNHLPDDQERMKTITAFFRKHLHL